MAEVASRTFRVSFEITVTLNEIDDALVARTKDGWNNPSLAAEPEVEEHIARERRLLAALIARPDVLRWEALRQIAWELDSIRRADQNIRDFGVTNDTDGALIEQLQDDLTPDDAEHFRDLVQADVFPDTASFFQAAFSTEIGSLSVADADDRDAAAVVE